MALHTIDSAELEKMLEKASCRGAEMALANVGLTDDQAIHAVSYTHLTLPTIYSV